MPRADIVDVFHGDVEPPYPDIDFHALQAAGVKGIILKSSQGSHSQDRKFGKLVGRALSVFGAGMVHSYHMLDNSDPTAQIENYLSVTDGMAGRWLDYEAVQGVPTPSLAQAIAACHDLAGKQGRFPGMYGSDGSLLGEALLGGHFTVCPLWIARYGPRSPMHRCDLWQFASGESKLGPPLSGQFYDVSVYLGRSNQNLIQWMKSLCVSG